MLLREVAFISFVFTSFGRTIERVKFPQKHSFVKYILSSTSYGDGRAPLIVRTSSVTDIVTSLRDVPAIGARMIISSFSWMMSSDNCPTSSMLFG